MNERPRRWWSRGAEGLTIIVSILLALLADAAWGYRGDRADERQLLDGLREEFVEAADEIGNDIAARDRILRRTETLIDARRDPAARPGPDSVREFVSDLLDWRFYTPIHAVLDDAIESGRVELIRSRQIRESLMAYLQARDRLPVFDQLERDFVTAQVEPFLGARIALDWIADPEADRASAAREAERFLGLLDDDRFGSLLYLRRSRTEQAQIYGRMVQRAIEDVRVALGGG